MPRRIFTIGEARDKGGHLKVAGDVVEIKTPALQEFFESAFDYDPRESELGVGMYPDQALALTNEAIARWAENPPHMSRVVQQEVLQGLLDIRACVIRNFSSTEEFGIRSYEEVPAG